jgi:hypothetical protein
LFACLSPALDQPPDFRVDLLSDEVCRFSRGKRHPLANDCPAYCLFVCRRTASAARARSLTGLIRATEA